MRWSDGQPYTTDDIKFWYDTVLTDKRIAIRSGRITGKRAASRPAGNRRSPRRSGHFRRTQRIFPTVVAWAENDQTTRCPKHYLQQFHIDYNPKANELAKQRGFDSWIASFQSACGLHDDNIYFLNSSKKPCLNAWMFTVAPGENTEHAIAVRNPYYWKVDTAGNQLPYLDRIVYQMVADPQVLLLKTMQGQIDLMDQYIGTPNNKSVLYDAQGQGRLRLLHADLDRGQRDVLHAQPQPQRCHQTEAVPEPRFPRRAGHSRSIARR